MDPLAAIDEQLDRALESFRHGSFSEFDRLLGADGSGHEVCAALASIAGAAAPIALPLPDRFNDYHVIREIGRGGMGVVLEAVQAGTGRKVALKMIHRGRDSLARLFRREIDSLSRLKHPSIATLYDAGCTSDGQDFLVMELVAGTPLDRYIASQESRRDLAHQLRLFTQVCRAVSYAHRHGVIHCDLKPSNVIINSEATPKVLDFGLARLLDTEAAHSAITEAGMLMGTLAYMSPEQVRGRRDEIDIRSDVYSLGVILFEWLTGGRPYPVHGNRWPEAARVICETPPKRPGLVDARLRGDLEIILLKTLAKEPEHRYASAGALADDIDRYLSGEAILARGPNVAYQLRKFVGRHRLGTAAAGLVMLLAVSLVGMIALESSRERAAAQRAERSKEFLVRMLAGADPNDTGNNVRVQDLLANASAGLDSELADQPEVRASLHEILGRSYLGLCTFDAAKKHFEECLALRQRLYGVRHPSVASAMHGLGMATMEGIELEAGVSLIQQAYDMRLQLLGEDHFDVTESELALATVSRHRGDFPGAEKYARQALAKRRALMGEGRSVAEALRAVARISVECAHYDEARPLLSEAVDMQRRLLGPDNLNVSRTLTDLFEVEFEQAHFEAAERINRERVRIMRKLFPEGTHELANALTDLANTLEINCNFDDAEKTFREAIAMERSQGGPLDPALCLNDFGAFLRLRGRALDAEPLCREVYRLWADTHPNPHPAKAYASANLGLTLLDLGRLEEAEPLLVQAIECWRKLFGKQNPAISSPLIGLGRLRQQQGKLDDAQRCFEEAVEICRSRLGETHYKTAMARVWLASLHRAQGVGKPAEEFDSAIWAMLTTLKECNSLVVWARQMAAEATSPRH